MVRDHPRKAKEETSLFPPFDGDFLFLLFEGYIALRKKKDVEAKKEGMVSALSLDVPSPFILAPSIGFGEGSSSW